MNPAATVLDFINRVNQHDADQLAELMTEDHVFIDSLGRVYADNKPVYDILARSKAPAAPAPRESA